MKKALHLLLFPLLTVPFLIILPAAGWADDNLQFNSSTQFIWGDDEMLGDAQSILAQYIRFGYNPQSDKYSITGYVRAAKDFSGHDILRSDDIMGRVYFLYLDYRPINDVTLRLGRQYVNFTSGSSVLDGASLNLNNLGPIGITLAGGMNVQYSLDSDYSRLGNYVWGIDVHLNSLKPVQAGISYTRRYDHWDNSRSEFGANARVSLKYFSPYGEVRYDEISRAIDEATLGLDVFPKSDLMLKLEYYQEYPTFDSTSIYSVFAVDKYSQYLFNANYTISAPVSVYVQYTKQIYGDGPDDTADVATVGARATPLRDIVLNGSVDYRTGYGGNLWGFQLSGDYKVKKDFRLSAGAQYDIYRPQKELALGAYTGDALFDDSDSNFQVATRLWAGAEYTLNKQVTFGARIADDINENFDHRSSGYLFINYTL